MGGIVHHRRQIFLDEAFWVLEVVGVKRRVDCFDGREVVENNIEEKPSLARYLRPR
jgi:hypothetical protein